MLGARCGVDGAAVVARASPDGIAVSVFRALQGRTRCLMTVTMAMRCRHRAREVIGRRNGDEVSFHPPLWPTVRSAAASSPTLSSRQPWRGLMYGIFRFSPHPALTLPTPVPLLLRTLWPRAARQDLCDTNAIRSINAADVLVITACKYVHTRLGDTSTMRRAHHREQCHGPSAMVSKSWGWGENLFSNTYTQMYARARLYANICMRIFV
jgi:hypothetical protein